MLCIHIRISWWSVLLLCFEVVTIPLVTVRCFASTFEFLGGQCFYSVADRRQVCAKSICVAIVSRAALVDIDTVLLPRISRVTYAFVFRLTILFRDAKTVCATGITVSRAIGVISLTDGNIHSRWSSIRI